MIPFAIERIRGEFAALGGRQRTIWFDNPAGTQVPGRVARAVGAAMTSAASNLGGSVPASRRAVEIWDGAHAALADLL